MITDKLRHDATNILADKITHKVPNYGFYLCTAMLDCSKIMNVS